MKTLPTALLATLVLAQVALYAAPPAPYAAFAKTRHRAPATTAPATTAPARAELEKRVERTFAVDAVGDLRLDNRHGDIDYRVHAANEVRIEVLIQATAGSERKAQALLDRVDVALSGARDRVSAETKVRGGRVVSVSAGDGKSKGLSVDYVVHAPPGFRLALRNSFGDVRLPDLVAPADIEVSYGDLETGDLAAGTEVAIGFGDAVLGFGERLAVGVKYGKLDLAGAGEATVHARFSEMRLGRFRRLELDSEYGKYTVQSAAAFVNEGGFNDFRIDSAESIRVGGHYNDVHVGYLATAGDVSVGFGDVHIASTSERLERLSFEGSYTDLTAVLAEGLGYTMSAAASYGDIRYPKQGFTATEQVGKAAQERRVEGHRDGPTQAVLTLRSSFGDLTVRSASGQ